MNLLEPIYLRFVQVLCGLPVGRPLTIPYAALISIRQTEPQRPQPSHRIPIDEIQAQTFVPTPWKAGHSERGVGSETPSTQDRAAKRCQFSAETDPKTVLRHKPVPQ